MIDDWVTLKSQRVLDTPWFGMRADTCQLSNGNVIEDFYVLEYRDWANVLALTPEQDVVLIKQYRHGLGQTCLELPAGIVDEVHEDREAAALNAIKRELLEETGYGGGQFIPLASLSPNPATHTNLSHAFLALDVTKEALQTLEDSEQIEVVLTPLTKLIELAETGQLRQALHVSTLFLALKKLETLKEET